MLVCNILFDFCTLNCPKRKKSEKNIFSKKNWKIFFLYFFNFSFLIGFIQPKSLPKICLMSYYHDHIEKKYVTCISFAYLGIIFKKNLIFFCIFKIFHFWSDLYSQNHVQQFVSCLIFMVINIKSMWSACQGI